MVNEVENYDGKSVSGTYAQLVHMSVNKRIVTSKVTIDLGTKLHNYQNCTKLYNYQNCKSAIMMYFAPSRFYFSQCI